MNTYTVRFEYLRDEQADTWELLIEAMSEDDARERIHRGRAPLRVIAVEADHPPCHWCGRGTSQGDYVRVSTERAGIVRCCDVCWERGQEAMTIPLENRGLLDA